jgi:hypothetical protein
MHRKETQRQRRLLRLLAALVMAAGSAHAVVQTVGSDDDAEYPPLTMPQLKYISLSVNADQLDSTSKSGGGGSHSEQVYMAPTVAIGWDYFLYHPNLMTFSLLAEPGYSWQQYNVDGSSLMQDSLVLNGTFSGTILAMKPYSTSVNYSRSRGEYHYDFFSSATSESESWGVSSGYHQGPVPFTVSFQHSLTDNTGYSYASQTEQNHLNLLAKNERHDNNYTDLLYQFDTYDNTVGDNLSGGSGITSFQSKTSTHYLTVTDLENFKNSSLYSSLYYNHFEEDGQTSDSPGMSLNYTWQHTPHLRSFYDASVSDYSTDAANSVNSYGRAGVQHQLYESLTSTFDVHGSDSSSDYAGSQSGSFSMGAGVAESYTKRLGSWGNLSLSDRASYDQTHQDSAGFQSLIPNESYSVPISGLFFLKSPRVITVQNVFYVVGPTRIPLDGSPGGDYSVNTATDPWQIQIYATGPNHVPISSGTVQVEVTYLVEPNPSGDYSTFNNSAEVRLRFWHSRASVFARYLLTDNMTDMSGFILENTREFQTGADLNWKNLRLNANYDDRESSLYTYQSTTLSEGYTLFSTIRHNASLNFNQQWSTYGNPSGSGTSQSHDMEYYSFTGQYGWHLGSSLGLNCQAGYMQQSSYNADQESIVFRADFSWRMGKLDLKLGYQFENQEYIYETRGRNYVYLNMRRTF